MPIKVLPGPLVSQIAAGEVVERPASVVKELIENSLDAGARSITVDLERGGLRLIRVRDDGAGIPRAELALALKRHATSKITDLDGLERVATLGFRGEALPSIASVGDLTITSRAAAADRGYAVRGGGDEGCQPVRPAPHPPGTTVEVRDLFAQIPARRKFMRTEATEFRHAHQVFRSLAAASPGAAFRLRHNEREVLHLPAAVQDEQALADRVRRLCGPAFLEHALRLDDSAAGMRLEGWVATPGFSRSRADVQYSFVNGRVIRDRLVNHAVRAAYEDVLHHQRFPAFVLSLHVDPATVDVNAHPAKAEVRFRSPRLVHDFVFQSLHQALAEHTGHEHSRRISLPWRTPGLAVGGAPGRPAAQAGLALAETAAAYRFQAPPVGPHPGAAHTTPQLGYALGQLRGVYILAENEAGLVLVDMHAGHERVLYERLKQALAAGAIPTQPLLVPETVEVGDQAADLAEEHAAALMGLGLELDRTGPARVVLRALPALLGEADGTALVHDVLSDLAAESGADRVRRAQERILGDLGCRAAIKAGRGLAVAEMNALLRDMEGTERAGHCNHGRPTWVQVDLAELDRIFMRGQ